MRVPYIPLVVPIWNSEIVEVASDLKGALYLSMKCQIQNHRSLLPVLPTMCTEKKWMSLP